MFVSSGSVRMDCPFFEWMCVHVAHRLGQCMGHTEGLPVCAHNVNDAIQSLGFGARGPALGCQLFFSCVALALTISVRLSPLLKTRWRKMPLMSQGFSRAQPWTSCPLPLGLGVCLCFYFCRLEVIPATMTMKILLDSQAW